MSFGVRHLLVVPAAFEARMASADQRRNSHPSRDWLAMTLAIADSRSV